MKDLDDLIARYKADRRVLETEREVIIGKLTAVGEFITDLQMLKDIQEQERGEG